MKKIGKWTLRSLAIAFISLLLLEFIYRYEWIDFYSKEWQYQNENLPKHNSATNKILVFGDSFSADETSWVAQLAKDSSVQVFNASLSGIGPETHRLLYKNRVEEVKPSIIIVQLFIGNDLYDIRKPVSWRNYSVGRNLFWSLSNTFRSLNFINYRLGQFSVEDGLTYQPKEDTIFSVEHYSPREKLYIQGNQNYPQNVIEVDESQKTYFEKMISFLTEMKSNTPPNCDFKILLIPHCCQVNEKYVNQFNALGSSVNQTILGNDFWKIELEKEGFKVIDVLPTLIQHKNQGVSQFYPNDIHLNELGQKIVGEYILKQINIHP